MNCASIYVFSVYVGHMYVQDWLPNYVSSMCSLHVYAFKISVGKSGSIRYDWMKTLTSHANAKYKH